MRELDTAPPSPLPSCAIVGRGRLGTALVGALSAAGVEVAGPIGRGDVPGGAGLVLLCIPDGEIAPTAAAMRPGPVVGHCSGALALDAIAPRHEALGLHPLMTVTGPAAPLAGAGAAVAGTTPRALAWATELAERLEMVPFTLADDDRAAYHAAASMASNYLVALEAAAERLGAPTGLRREHLVALVRGAVDGWARLGPRAALTGPIARGDGATVARQRASVAARAPELAPLWDALADRTRALAGAAP